MMAARRGHSSSSPRVVRSKSRNQFSAVHSCAGALHSIVRVSVVGVCCRSRTSSRTVTLAAHQPLSRACSASSCAGSGGAEPAPKPRPAPTPKPPPPPPPYCDEKVANREIRVWHFVIENGY
jgi:hypothetical protein